MPSPTPYVWRTPRPCIFVPCRERYLHPTSSSPSDFLRKFLISAFSHHPAVYTRNLGARGPSSGSRKRHLRSRRVSNSLRITWYAFVGHNTDRQLTHSSDFTLFEPSPRPSCRALRLLLLVSSHLVDLVSRISHIFPAFVLHCTYPYQILNSHFIDHTFIPGFMLHGFLMYSLAVAGIFMVFVHTAVPVLVA